MDVNQSNEALLGSGSGNSCCSQYLFGRLNRSSRRTDRRGAMLFMIAVVLVIFLLASAYAVNVAWMQLVDTELRCATDAATRAGGEALGRGLSIEEATQEIQELAALNRVAGAPLTIGEQDIVFGFAEAQTGLRYSFTPDTGSFNGDVNAVRVAGNRVEGVGEGAVNLPFTGFLNRTSFQATKFATATIQERDLVLVIDRSGSMNTRDGGRDPDTNQKLTRMQALKHAVGIFRNVIDDTDGEEKLGLASYSTNSTEDLDLTFDYHLFDEEMDSMNASGRTNIGAGIDSGINVLLSEEFSRPVAQPILIVMTDGRHNETRDPEEAAEDALDLDGRVQIHTVTFSSGADQNRMKRVADIGNGQHHHADDFGELVDVFDEIARTAGAALIE